MTYFNQNLHDFEFVGTWQIQNHTYSNKSKSFTVKTISPGQNRDKTDIIELFWRGSIHAFDLQIDLKAFLLQKKAHAKKNLSNHWSNLLCTLISRIFLIAFKIGNFSVKSSWEVYWIVMSQKDAVWNGVQRRWKTEATQARTF